jgi:hypothetical protein
MSSNRSIISSSVSSSDLDNEYCNESDEREDGEDSEEMSTVSSTSAKVEAPKTRGRKKGQTMQKFFILACVNEAGEIVLQHHKGNTLEEAKKEFSKANGGMEPTASLNGRGLGYFVVGSKSSKDSQAVVVAEDDSKPTVNISTEFLARRTAHSFRGVYQGWNVTASGFKSLTVNGKNYTDDELLQVYVGKPIDGCTKSKPKLNATTLVKRQYIDSLVLAE